MKKTLVMAMLLGMVSTMGFAAQGDISVLAGMGGNSAGQSAKGSNLGGGLRFDAGNGIVIDGTIAYEDIGATNEVAFNIEGYYHNFGLRIGQNQGDNGSTDLFYGLGFRVEQPVNENISVGIKANVLEIRPGMDLEIITGWQAYLVLAFMSI
ncbi:MAG: hypothetical protein HRT90_06535 [Candidatus Margulisbacteria bacterium]|nr:hypothetical protein [Candidatus Margulisiibacteriota bacterium]